MSFFQFYQQGGLFMHVISLTALGCIVSIARRAFAARQTTADPKRPAALDGGVTPWLAAAGVLMGMGGTAMGIIEGAAALQTIPQEMWPMALSRVFQIVTNPLVLATMLFIPILVAHGLLRQFELRISRALRGAAISG
jgi:hypothetical protein